MLVFDWDGTVIDSASTIAECIRLAAGDIGLAVPTKEQASHVIGLGLHDALKYAVPDLRGEQMSEFVARYRHHFLSREDAMGLFDGMRQLLADLHREKTLGIATGKSRRGLDRSLEATGLRPYFHASRCADETHPKPHPAMLMELMQEFDVPAEQMLMIGDTSHDLDMARAAGVDALAVTYGAHAETGLRACQPRGCVGSVAELRQWLSANA
ncbi:MAG TPA: HAD-IA family hydrolase [Burkholderiales bacterium]|nr:HAD-IA family hydrolase [Burkholderiales bacterium]